MRSRLQSRLFRMLQLSGRGEDDPRPSLGRAKAAWYPSRVRRILAAIVTLAAFASACASPPGDTRTARPRVAAAAAVTGPRAPLTRRAPLRYDVGGRAFPLPIVRGSIGGHPTLLLVDTGANVHVVAGWLARKLRFDLKKLGEQGTDHLGRSITTWQVDFPRLALEQWGAVGATSMIVIEIPQAFEKLGIGGILSPQKLADEGDAVVLDLYGGEMRAAWWDDAARELSASGTSLVTSEIRACEEPDGNGTGLAYVVPSAIDGQKVSLLVDTGAQRSDVLASSPAGQKLAPRSVADREPMYTASGKVVIRRVHDARIETGGFAVAGDIGVVEGSADRACPRDGMLGMDVLRACRLLLGRTRFYGTCSRIDGAR